MKCTIFLGLWSFSSNFIFLLDMVGRTGPITSSRVAEAVSLATGHIRRWSTSA
jgi:hypothetical protein